jgi:hypothetical protein
LSPFFIFYDYESERGGDKREKINWVKKYSDFLDVSLMLIGVKILPQPYRVQKLMEINFSKLQNSRIFNLYKLVWVKISKYFWLERKQTK